ncbi:MAG: twin-arginine translocase subunit TatC [Planctomycetes bacterium]|nr:twin-arginine translocase subunit TatC [Planctomycetota bacterium]
MAEPGDSTQEHPSSPAPPHPGGADDDIAIVESNQWQTDGDGYPAEAGVHGIGQPPAYGESAASAITAFQPDANMSPPVNYSPQHADSQLEPDTDPESSLPRSMWDGVGPHLEELRKRIVYSLAAFLPFFAIGLWRYRDLWRIVMRPIDSAAPNLLRFQALSPSDGLVMAMRLSFAFALFLSMPILLSQVWNFVAPGLTSKERRWLYLGLGSGGVLFILGVLLAYFVGVPFALEYLLPFNQSMDGWENAFTGFGYVDFVVTCCAGFGFAFELPLVMLFLGWIGLLTPEGLRAWWRPVIIVIFVVAAIMTPPDPFTQMLLAVPLLLLFGLGYILVRWTASRK